MTGKNQVNSVGSGNINIGRDYIAGDKVMGDKISGNKVIGDKNSITGNTFTQTNNADTAELIKLITTLRQTATQFPAEIQEGAIIDIEDLETEIQKPADKRSIPRLKRSLLALLAIAGTIATPIAGITDFTNNVLEIGSKLHITLPSLR